MKEKGGQWGGMGVERGRTVGDTMGWVMARGRAGQWVQEGYGRTVRKENGLGMKRGRTRKWEGR